MGAPSPEFIVSNPAPLNRKRGFPFLVQPFPAQWLLEFAGMGRAGRGHAREEEQRENPNRVED